MIYGKYKQITDKYFIKIGIAKSAICPKEVSLIFEEVEGTKIAVKGFSEIPFFIHKNKDTKMVILSEAFTGRSLGQGLTKTKAVKHFLEQGFTITELENKIEERLKEKKGLSPRYKEELKYGN